MAQANNSTTPVARNKSGTDRRTVLQLIGGGVAALPSIAEAESETAIAAHFEIRRRFVDLLRGAESTEREADEIFNSLRPQCPRCLQLVNADEPLFASWVIDSALPEIDRTGRIYRRIPAGAIHDAIVRLERVCPPDAPILVAAKESLPIARNFEEREARAWRDSASSECLRETDSKRELVAEIEEVILALDATCAEDLRMQAAALLDNHLGIEIAPPTKRFLNSILTSRFLLASIYRQPVA